MSGLLIVLFIVLVGGACAAETFILVATGNWRWDEYVSRTSKKLWLGGYVGALVVSPLLFGLSAVLSAWPVWLALPLGTFTIFGGLDRLFKVGRPRQPRVITHADGTTAVVDARAGARYQRLPASPATRTPSPLDRWLNEKV